MNFESLLGRLRRQHLEAAGRSARRSSRPKALKVESLETREVPATLPAPIVDYTTTKSIVSNPGGVVNQFGNTDQTINIPFGFFSDGGNSPSINFVGATAPTIVADPTNPDQLFGAVEMLGNGNATRIAYIFSTNGGKTWSGPSVSRVFDNGLDPNATTPNSGVKVPYTQVSAPSVAYDRFHNVFLTYVEHDSGANGGNGGRVVLRKLAFANGGTPTPVDLDFNAATFTSYDSQKGMGSNAGNEKVLYRWVGTDGAFNPTVAIDTNLGSYLDPNQDSIDDGLTVAKRTQTDPFAALQTTANNTRVFVAWNSNDTAPTNPAGGFVKNAIRMTVSQSGGKEFGPSVLVNDMSATFHSNGNGEQFNAPKIAFVQGRAGLASSGGKMVTLFTSTVLNRLYAESYNFAVAGAPFTSENSTTNFGPLNDATTFTDASGNVFQVPRTTTLNIPVDAGSLTKIDKMSVQFGLANDDLHTLMVELVSPTGVRLTLFNNRLVNTAKNDTGVGLPAGGTRTSLGLLKSAFYAGTTFEDNAARNITDANIADGYSGSFRPEAGSLVGKFGALTAAQITGTWQVVVTDFINSNNTGVDGFLGRGTIKLSQNFKDGLGTDKWAGDYGGSHVGFTVAPDNFYGTGHPTANAANPNGSGSSLSVVTDNTLGVYSPYQNRIYAAYNNGGAKVVYSDDGGVKWSFDGPASAGGFNPQIAVDQTTGAVLVSSYSASQDPTGKRALTLLATSINGPNFQLGNPKGTLEFSTPAPVNPKDTTFDEITRKTLDVEYVSSNGPVMGTLAGNTEGFGNNTGLVSYAGKVKLVYAGNLDRAVSQIRTQQMTIASGPRVSASDTGVVLGKATLSNTITGTPQVYNIVDADKGAQFTGFFVEFDRAVRYITGGDTPAQIAAGTQWFTKDDIVVRYRAPSEDSAIPGLPLAVKDPVPLDDYSDPISGQLYGAKRFFVELVTPQTAAGTYSYVVGNYDDTTYGPTADTNSVADRVRVLATPLGTGPTQGAQLAPGNEMDQNGDAIQNDPSSHLDVYAVPAPVNDTPFVAPFKTQSLPIIVPGPYVVDSQVHDTVTVTNAVQRTITDRVGATITPVASNIDITEGSANDYVQNVTVTVNITHANVSDLELKLTSPGGIVVRLVNQGTVTGPNLSGTTFDDASLLTVGTASTPYSGTYAPVDPLSNFDFGTVNGAWTLTVTDRVAGTAAGTLDSWTLNVQRVSAAADNLVYNAAAKAIDFQFDRKMNTATISTADILRLIGPAGDLPLSGLALFPISALGGTALAPATGNSKFYRITFPERPLPGQYQVQLSSDMADEDGQKMDKDTNAGVNVLLGTPPGGLVTQTGTPGLGVIQQSYGGVISQTVAADGLPHLIELDINGPTDGYLLQKLTATLSVAVAANRTLRDLEVTLLSPGGAATAVLFKDAPRTGPDTTITNVTFTDDAATPVQSGIASAGGKNNPVELLAGFIGLLAKGKWHLQVINRGTAVATVSKFALTLDKPVITVGLGDTVADQTSLGFRVFFSDELKATGNKNWIPVGADGNTTFPNAAGGGVIAQPTTNGRVSVIAVDPSDASGNTVYAGGASGGLWRTTNFLTRGDLSQPTGGPTWVPLTDFGPNQEVTDAFGNVISSGSAINIGSLTVINETGDPLQTKVIVGTGSAALNTIDNQDQPADRFRFDGVGFLYSEDAGKSWNVLDSTTNYAVPTGSPPGTLPKYLPVADAQRDHLFVGAVINKVVVERKIVPSTDLNVLYAAVGRGATPAADQVAGLWRSFDGGRKWSQIYRDPSGRDVTDFAIGEGSAQQDPGGSGSGSFLHPTIGYVAVQGTGVLTTSNLNAAAGVVFTLISGGVGRPTINQNGSSGSVPVSPPSMVPNGFKGQILLATPSFQTGNTYANNFYQGWLVALVSGGGGNFDGLYVTKDQGLNWTRLRLNTTQGTNGFGLTALGFQDGGNDLEQTGFFGSLTNNGADHSLTLAMDPTDPNILYVGSDTIIRVDMTQANDPYKLQLHSHTDDTGAVWTTAANANTSGAPSPNFSSGLIATDPVTLARSDTPYDDNYDLALRAATRRKWDFLNLKYDPYTPFDKNTTLFTNNLTGFTNNGADVPWVFASVTRAVAQTFFGPVEVSNIKEAGGDVDWVSNIVTYVDPLTGKARVVWGHDEGIGTFVSSADGTHNEQNGFTQVTQDGTVLTNGGKNLQVEGSRNGNMQVARFYSGDIQPSAGAAGTAADIAKAMFYGAAHRVADVMTGEAIGDSPLMDTGNLSWGQIGRFGRTNYVTTDPTGSGTVYILRRINEISPTTDFFQIQEAGGTPISRTNGLFRNNPADAQGSGQWTNSVRRFTVNTIDKNGISMGSNAGRLFSTVDQGRNWFISAEPTDLDSTYVQAVAYGAPVIPRSNPLDPPAGLNDYLYAGTAGGRIYVKTGNFLSPAWKNISANLDGSPIQKIVANPLRGSNSVYAVTDNGVYYMADWTSANVALNKWKNISGNLFAITHQAFGLGADYETTLLQRLSTIAVDWRPLNFFTPGTPVLYAGGDGGVFRSLDNGNSWNRFTDATTNGLSEGGGLPVVKVTDLDLAIGNVIQNTGRNEPDADKLPNLLAATTLGRGTWAIALITPNDQPIIDPITDVTVLEDSAQKTVNLTGISPGQGEVTQTLTITAVATDPATGLPSTVITPPVVTYVNPEAAGTLTFTPVANKNGDVLITITEKDDGGVLGGGSDTRVVTFLVHVTPVNDRPTLTKPTDLVINEDAGQQTVTLTGLSDGEPTVPNEGQILTVTATSNPAGALIIPNPVVTYVNGQPTALLKFTPNPDQFTAPGTPVTITVTAKDNAGVMNGGQDTKTQTFTVFVTSVNDAPSFVKGPDIYTNKNAPAQTFPSWATLIKKGPANENSQTVAFTVTNNATALFTLTGQPAIDPFGTLTYTPAANASGVALVSVFLKDNGGGVAPNVDTSATQTFVIQLGVNRAPVLDNSFNPELLPIGQGTTTSAGTLVSALLGTAFSDPDPASPQGIAVIGVSNVADGDWEFSTDDGVSWQNLESASLTTAVLLRSQDRVRFNNPTLSFLGQPTIMYHAWDQSAGMFGGTADLTGNIGGSSPFSVNSEIATAFVAKLLATFPEDGGPAKLTLKGTALTGISFTSISDNDTKAKKGVAVVGVGGEIPGQWQYSINSGTTWLDFGAVGPTAARLLRETDKVRFLPAANRSGETFIRVAAWDQTSGLPGKTADLTAAFARGGSKAFSVLDAFFVLRITPLNDQPAIDTAAANFLTQILPTAPADDSTAFGPAGDRVSDVLGSVATDQDAGSALGMAVSAATKIGGGAWQYRGPTDTIWQGFPILPVANVFLLKPDDFIRFKPDGATEGTATITYKAWDQTFGARLAVLIPAATNTAFSKAPGVAKVVVSSGAMPPANVPPMLDNAPARSFTAVLEDATAPAGNAVSVFAATATAIWDTDAKGIAVTGVTGDTAGTWKFSLNNGTSWLPVGAVGTGFALLLKDTDKLRYVPRANFNGTDIASVKYRAWDRTVGTAGKLANLTTLAADSPFSAAATEEMATLTVTPVNDPPVLDIKPLAIVTPTTAGSGVAQLLGTAFSDIDGPAQGVAVTSVSKLNGRWQFTTNFAAPTPTWNDVVNVNSTNFLFLNAAGGVRFVPTGAAVDAFITFKAWDQSAGVAGVVNAVNITTPALKRSLSLLTEKATAKATAGNDAPVLDITPVVQLPSVAVETDTTPDTTPATATGVLTLLANATDSDTADFKGIAVIAADQTHGNWEFYDGTTWFSLGGVTGGNAVLLDSTYKIRFTPIIGFSGTSTFKYKAWDQTFGAPKDVVSTLGSTAFSTAYETASIAVNTAPVLVV